jgi:hypothetical protein
LIEGLIYAASAWVCYRRLMRIIKQLRLLKLSQKPQQPVPTPAEAT